MSRKTSFRTHQVIVLTNGQMDRQ